MRPASHEQTLRVGDTLELRVERLALGGDGLGRAGACAVFVPYAVPGDLLDITVTESRERYARGQIRRVIEPSPDRIAPPCPYHFQPPRLQTSSPESQVLSPGLWCGGCSWQQLRYPAQLAAKRQLVLE